MTNKPKNYEERKAAYQQGVNTNQLKQASSSDKNKLDASAVPMHTDAEAGGAATDPEALRKIMKEEQKKVD